MTQLPQFTPGAGNGAYRSLMVTLSGLIWLTGCTLSKPNPSRQQYLVETRRHAHAAPPRTEEVLRVRPFRVSAAFDQRSFVYRLGEAQYVSDFYHQFMVVPGNLFAEQTRSWLSDAGIFEAVLPPASPVTSTYNLEGTITRLYGDFRDMKSPKAVLAIEFTMVKSSSARAIRFQRTYRQETGLEAASPPALARGWSECLEGIFKTFEKDLLTLDWKSPSPTGHPPSGGP